MTRTLRLAVGTAAALFLALHLLFLPTSLEDLDSINFALGIRDFDVARHQPHPPGYPVFIAAAKAVNAVLPPEVRALSFVSALGGAFGVIALFALFTMIDAPDRDRFSQGTGTNPFVWTAVLLAAGCPLLWMTAARPLSDMAGLGAALGVQALTLSARTSRRLIVAAFLAGLAAGIRSQVLWLTVPLLVTVVIVKRRELSRRSLLLAAAAYVAGAATWFVPLIAISGGVAQYQRALLNQGAEDLTGVKMLATNPTPRQLLSALQSTFLSPWGNVVLGSIVLALAIAGKVLALLRQPRALGWLAAAFGPYTVFHLLFQETVTTRYALPIVVPVVYLAICALAAIPWRAGLAGGVALVAACAWIDDRAMVQYSRMDAPAFRMLADMAKAQSGGPLTDESRPPDSRRPVLAMHRREEFDLRRPIAWMGGSVPDVERRLPATAKHEWLELVKYWNEGGRTPIWFVADPLRSDLALMRLPARPRRYRWALESTALIGGVRPSEMDWYVIEPPDWYLGEGWALTPETAGIAKEDRRGPAYAPAQGWIRRWEGTSSLMIGGRNLGLSGRPGAIKVVVGGVTVLERTVEPGFYLETRSLAPFTGGGDYVPISVESDNPDVVVEQFDVQPAGRVVYGFDQGWHEQEYNPSTGVLWRWASERASIRVRAGGHRLALTLRGELEEASSSRVIVRAGDQQVAEFTAEPVFSRTIIIPADLVQGDEARITIESSAWYVPAETRWRSGDRRHLALKLVECSVTPVS